MRGWAGRRYRGRVGEEEGEETAVGMEKLKKNTYKQTKQVEHKVGFVGWVIADGAGREGVSTIK